MYQLFICSGFKWVQLGLDEVRNYVCETRYPKERFHVVQGDIKETVPNNRHKKIALLQLDTGCRLLLGRL